MKKMRVLFNPLINAVQDAKNNKYFKERMICAFWGTFVFSMAANAFAYFNFYPQHDSLNHTFGFAGKWEVRLGRFLLPLYGDIRGKITMPWLIGLLSMIYIAIAVYLICDMMDVKYKSQIILLAGFCSANITITQMCAVFMYIDDAYLLSLLFATLGVWAAKKVRGVIGVLCSAVSFLLSMGLYQAYVAVAVILFMLIISRDLLLEKKAWRTCFLQWIRYVVVLILGAVLYYIFYKFALNYWGVTPASSSNSISQIFQMSAKDLILQVLSAYKNFYIFFFGDNIILGNRVKYSTIILIIMATVTMIKQFKMKRVPLYNCLTVIIIAFFYPAVSLIMSIMMQKGEIDYLVSYGLCFVYPILLMIIYNKGNDSKPISQFEKINRIIAVALSMLILFANISFSNAAYTVQKVMYDRTLSMMTRVMDEIDGTEGYISGETEIVFLGIKTPENINQITDKYATFRAFKPTSISYTPQPVRSFASFLGYDIQVQADADIVAMYMESPIVQEMPCYPNEGYCQMVDERIVVKFSN